MNKASLAAEIREHGIGYVVDNASPVKYALLQGFILGLLDRPDAVARPEEANMERAEWLIWSGEHVAWWGSNHSGYYHAIEHAGWYTLTEARKICTSRSWDDRRPPETMLHIDSLPPSLRRLLPERVPQSQEGK